MALQDILTEINNKLQSELQKIANEEQKAVTDIKNRINNEEKLFVSSIRNQKEERIQSLKQKTKSIEHMEGRNELLKRKKQLLDEVFSNAVDELSKLDENTYKTWLESALKQAPQFKGEIIPAKGREKITEAVMKKVLPDCKLGSAGNFKGGVIARSEKMEIDMTFESIVEKQIRDDLEIKISSTLFEE
jgi:V/A-type H+-transporting ATPase subunit E